MFNLPSPSISITSASKKRWLSASRRALLSTLSGPLRNTPWCISTSNSFGFFSGAFQPWAALNISFEILAFNGTLTPRSVMPLSVTLEEEYDISFTDTTTSPSFTFARSKPPQQPTLNTALGPKTSTAFITTTQDPCGTLDPV